MNQPIAETAPPETVEPTKEVSEADAAQAAEENKPSAQSKYLQFVKVWQTSANTAEVAERLSTPEKTMSVGTAQARASKYRTTVFKTRDKKNGDGATLYQSIVEGETETTDKANAKKIGGKGPNAGKLVPVQIRVQKDGKDIVLVRGINLKHMPKGGGRQLDVGAAEALIAELAKEG